MKITKPKITPGPWHVVPQPWDDSATFVNAQSQDPHVGQPICDTGWGFHDHTKEDIAEWQRNAQAISAMHELINSLIDAYKVVEVCNNISIKRSDLPTDLFQKELHAIKASLKKAGCTFEKEYTLEDLIQDLDIGKRAEKALRKMAAQRNHYHKDSPIWLHHFPAKEFIKLRGCGPDTIQEIIEACEEKGIALDQTDFNS